MSYLPLGQAYPIGGGISVAWPPPAPPRWSCNKCQKPLQQKTLATKTKPVTNSTAVEVEANMLALVCADCGIVAWAAG